MKKAILFVAFLGACGPKEEPATDTAAMAVGPAALTASDVAGTWSGVIMPEGSDTTPIRFTAVINPTGDGKAITEGQKDSVNVTHVLDGDSVVATSAPHVDPMIPGKPEVTWRAVGRLVGGKIVGTSATMLASKPDSVLGRARFEMTRNP
jgi:hypothetical protein